MALGILDGLAAMMEVTETTTDLGEMVSIGQLPGKTEEIQVTKQQKVEQSCQPRLFYKKKILVPAVST